MTHRRNVRAIALALVALLLSVTAASAQSAQVPFGMTVLKERAVFIAWDDYGRNVHGNCLGFRLWSPDLPLGVELVLTAAHCVADMSSNIDITVTSQFGWSGKGVRWLWSRDYDVGFLLVKAPLGLGPIRPIPVSQHYDAPLPQTQVMALISIGGGRPTPASGHVEGMDGVYVTMMLPGGHGSSGGAVVGRNTGALVGLITNPGPGADVFTPDSASSEVNAIGARMIFQILSEHIGELLTAAHQIAGR